MPEARGDRLSWIVMIVLVMVWGSAFAFLRVATEEIPPAWVAALRLWTAAATLFVCVLISRETIPAFSTDKASPWPWYAFVGAFCMALPFFCFAWAATKVPSAVNAICNGASPIFTAVMTHMLVAGDRMTGRKWLGVAMGFVGLIVLVGPGALSHLGGESTIAEMVALFGAGLYAVGNIAIKRAPPVGTVTGAFLMCLCGAIAATPAAFLVSGPPPLPSLGPLGAVLFLGVGPTGLASIGYVWMVKRRGPLFTSFATYLAPLWATLIGVAIMGERPGLEAFLALALILGGVAVANLRPRAVAPRTA